jgi:hypothetical protein
MINIAEIRILIAHYRVEAIRWSAEELDLIGEAIAGVVYWEQELARRERLGAGASQTREKESIRRLM